MIAPPIGLIQVKPAAATHSIGVKIFTNGVQYGSTLSPNSSGVFSTSWTQTNAGFYTFVATATDNDGNTSSSLPVTVEIMLVNTNANPPVAKITSPTPATTNIFSYVVTNAYVVRNGLLSLSGSAYSPDPGAAVAWQVILVDPTNPTNSLYNVTPGVLNSQGFATNAVNAGVLGTNFDLSMVQNGTYMLTLVVQSEGLQKTASLLIQVESNLKVGQFSFSEQDLVLPVNGIPITITRNYNSINPLSSDFGYSWTFAINDMDVQLDEQRTSVVVGSDQALFAETEEDSNGAPVIASIRTGGSYDVTLTLPDGRRTTFGFSPFAGSLSASAQWTAPPGVFATLTNFPFTSGAIDYFPALMWHDSDPTWGPEPFYNHDVPGWMLQTQDGTQYIITRGNRNTVTYNTDGAGTWRNILTYGLPKLTSIVQRTGDKLTIGANGIFHSTTNSTNVTRSVTFVRDGQNRITAIYDPNAGTNGLPAVQYVYNNDTGNLIQVLKLTDRVAGVFSTNKYIYANQQFPHYITEIDNGIGAPITRNFYDSSGRLTSSVDANGNTTQYIHNLTNSLEMVVDPRGNTNSFAYDSRGNVAAVTNAVGTVMLATYDGSNNKTNEVVMLNGAGYSTNNFGYDPNTGLLLASTNSFGFTNGFTYNNNGQLLTSVDALGHSSAYFYDLNTGSFLGTADALGNTTTNLYDTNSLLVSATDAAGAVITNQYDSLGNLIVTRTGYYSNSTFVALTSTGYAYDLDGNRVAMTNALGIVTCYGFDGQNRIVATTNNAYSTTDQTVTRTIYDAAGRVIQTVDAFGVTNAFSYNFAGYRTSQTRAAGTAFQQTIQSGYDAGENKTNEIDNLGRETDFQYDSLNRQTVQLFPSAVSGAARTGITNVYDGLDRRIAFTNQAGLKTGFQFDVLSRMIGVTNGLGKVTQYQFDALGNETNQVDALTHSTKFTFDALSRRTQTKMPGTQTANFGYDTGSRLVAQTNFDGTVITNQYDVLGRLMKRCNGATVLETYAYAATGLLTNRTDGSGSYSWVYDALGRVKTNATPVGTLYYTYDANGNVLTLSSATANGVSLTYQYDALNRLTNVIDNRLTGTKNTGYAFDGVGNLQSLAYPNGYSAFWQYDGLYRLTNLVWVKGSATNASFAYQLGPVGNRTSLADNVNGTARTFSWGYDNLYRLTNETVSGGSPTGTLGYIYDDAGNRTSRTGTLGTLTASNNTFDANDAVSGLVFDANGNTRTNGSIYYGYDWANRLTSQTNGSAVVTMAYGADGNRSQRTSSGTTTLYLVATVNPSGYPQVVEEFTASGGTTNLSMVYTYGLALISQRQGNGTVSFFGTDGLGSTRFLTSTNGTITDTYAYDAFGTVIASTGTTPNNYLFTGQQSDPLLNLVYLRQRYDITTLGRFLTRDAIDGDNGEPLSLHRYIYCQANPVNDKDPSGNLCEDPLAAVALGETAELGANVGLVAVRSAAYRTIAKAVLAAAVTALPETQTGPEPATPQVPFPVAVDTEDPSDAYVVRGGVATPDQLTTGAKAHRLVPGLTGFSVQSEPGKSIVELAAAGQFRNKQISVSTVAAIVAVGRTLGYNVLVVKSPGAGYHRTVTTPVPLPPRLAIGLSAAFVQMPNPSPF
jgi:RHS repeat-associated protein